MSKSKKTPWPTQKVMQQIYDLNFWGGKGQDFYSGEGSHLPELVSPYLLALKSFLQQFPHPPSLLDLGCGDFNIGSQLVPYTSSYIAADIVPELIEHHRKQHHPSHLKFEVLDLSKDELPKADIICLRQVLQHLSNSEIASFLPQLCKYKYLVLTEHLPNQDFTANQDIITGRNIRLKINSGVDLTQPPFNLTPIQEQVLCEVKEGNSFGGVLKTVLYQLQ